MNKMNISEEEWTESSKHEVCCASFDCENINWLYSLQINSNFLESLLQNLFLSLTRINHPKVENNELKDYWKLLRIFWILESNTYL